MKILPLCFLMLFSSAAAADNLLSEWWHAPKYNWVAGGYSQSIQDFGQRGLHISGGVFPEETGFGFQSYLNATKLHDPDDTDMVYTLGIEPVFKWNWVYVGLGLAVKDRRSAVSGTLWDFRQSLGIRYQPKKKNWFFDASLQHGSHCARCGVEEDENNSGVTDVVLQFGFTF